MRIIQHDVSQIFYVIFYYIFVIFFIILCVQLRKLNHYFFFFFVYYQSHVENSWKRINIRIVTTNFQEFQSLFIIISFYLHIFTYIFVFIYFMHIFIYIFVFFLYIIVDRYYNNGRKINMYKISRKQISISNFIIFFGMKFLQYFVMKNLLNFFLENQWTIFHNIIEY